MTIESNILSRVIDTSEGQIPREVAELILKLGFPQSDHDRMSDLAKKAKLGTLNEAEQKEAESYERIGHLVSLLKSKARTALKDRKD